MNTDQDRDIRVMEVEWEGITIEIAYEPQWLGMGGEHQTAHLELHVLHPVKAKIPVTDTGYRSHFIQREWVENAGGPIPFVLSWINATAQTKEWQEHQDHERQLSLF